MDKVVLGQASVPGFRFSPVSVTPPLFHKHSCFISAMDMDLLAAQFQRNIILKSKRKAETVLKFCKHRLSKCTAWFRNRHGRRCLYITRIGQLLAATVNSRGTTHNSNLNLLKPSGNYMYHLLKQPVSLHFAYRMYLCVSYFLKQPLTGRSL
jgi:hypothetical protein